ncbi:MAG: hypothetical protein QXS20_03370 [Candidatus Thorarchaeota archaeon]
MRRTLVFLAAAFVVAMFLMTPVMAATSQGLSWGIKSGDRFSFRLTATGTESDEPIDEGMYFDVEAAPPALPNVMTSYNDIPSVSLGAYFDNGTSIGFLAFLFIGIGLVGGKLAVPVGNFTLLTKLLTNLITENLTVKETYYFWTASSHGLLFYNAVQVETSYLKSDGFIAKYRMIVTNETHTLIDVSAVRLNLPSDVQDLIMSNLLYIAVGFVVLIIIGAVVCKKR